MSTRRQDGYEFDHGAQYFTVRGETFRDTVNRWRSLGMVDVWRGRIVNITSGVVRSDFVEVERLVPVPKMNALCRELSNSVPVTFDTRVSRIKRTDGAWIVFSETQREPGRFDRIIITAPPEQTLDLLPGASSLSHRVAKAEMLPCWTVMIAFNDRIDVDWDAAFAFESPISWVARNRSKPGRPDKETWVIHGSPEWSEAHIETDAKTVGGELATAFFEAIGLPQVTPEFLAIHRWRFAKTKKALGEENLYDPALGIGVCGDWCLGDRVEDAFMSGHMLAETILESL